MTYTTAHVRMPESSVVPLRNCSWRISAQITVPDAADAASTGQHPAEGVIACQGGNMSGWSLWLDEGEPRFTYNCFGHDITTLHAPALAGGPHDLVVDFAYDGGFGAGGELTLSIDGHEAARARLDRTVPLVFSMSGETFDVGTDTGSPVGPYRHDFRCTADIVGVTLERLTEPGPRVRATEATGLFRAAMSAQ
jgi:arylsulfatase